MHVTHAHLASDGYMLGFATLAWLAATAWALDRITGSLYDAAFAVIKTAAAAAGG